MSEEAIMSNDTLVAVDVAKAVLEWPEAPPRSHLRAISFWNHDWVQSACNAMCKGSHTRMRTSRASPCDSGLRRMARPVQVTRKEEGC